MLYCGQRLITISTIFFIQSKSLSRTHIAYSHKIIRDESLTRLVKYQSTYSLRL